MQELQTSDKNSQWPPGDSRKLYKFVRNMCVQMGNCHFFCQTQSPLQENDSVFCSPSPPSSLSSEVFSDVAFSSDDDSTEERQQRLSHPCACQRGKNTRGLDGEQFARCRCLADSILLFLFLFVTPLSCLAMSQLSLTTETLTQWYGFGTAAMYGAPSVTLWLENSP